VAGVARLAAVFRRELISRLRPSLFSIELPVYTTMICSVPNLKRSQQSWAVLPRGCPYNSVERVTLSELAAQSLVGGILLDIRAFSLFGRVFGIGLPAAWFVFVDRAGRYPT
jgi:hypothetical protein